MPGHLGYVDNEQGRGILQEADAGVAQGLSGTVPREGLYDSSYGDVSQKLHREGWRV